MRENLGGEVMLDHLFATRDPKMRSPRLFDQSLHPVSSNAREVSGAVSVSDRSNGWLK